MIDPMGGLKLPHPALSDHDWNPENKHIWSLAGKDQQQTVVVAMVMLILASPEVGRQEQVFLFFPYKVNT